jgi:hypothetical protein
VVRYHGLARRHLMPPRFLMRPLLNGGTLGGRGKWPRACHRAADDKSTRNDAVFSGLFRSNRGRRDVTTKAKATEGVSGLVQLLRTVAVIACGAVACGPRVIEAPAPSSSSRSSVPPPEWPDTAITDASALIFSVEGLEEPSNHAPVLRITLRNVTWDESLWVKYRVGASVNDAFYRDVLLDVIEGPPLRKIACSHCGISAERGALESYVQMGPQSAVSFLAGIYCSSLSPGHYRLVAHYRDDSKSPPDFPWRADWFAGALTSEPFEIDVSPLQRP